jgi:hypothetical protein
MRITFVVSILAATVLAALGVSSAGSGAAAASTGTLGVYVGYQAPGGVSSFGGAIGKQPTFAMDFLDGASWSTLVNTAPSYMSAWKGSGYTMIWGLPMLPNSGSTLGQGATGAYNSYFLQLAQDMVAAGQGSSVIRPGWEFNGGWFPWAANGQAAAFVTYWQQIVTTMRSVSGQHFTFEWNPTAGDQGVGNLANYYPGNAYVDEIGLDLYDQSWGTYAGIASQWNTDVTEPYGLDWLASFAASQGKKVTLPEWGLDPSPSTNNGGVVSAPNTEVGGGDDPTFINDMAQWITQNQVYEATYWQYNSSLLSSTSNPNSFAAFVQDFGSGSGGSSSSVGPTFPGGGKSGSTVTMQSPTGPVATWQGAHFSAVVSAQSGTTVPTGSVAWAISSRSGVTIPCRSGSTVISRADGTTNCNVGAGLLTAGDSPYTLSVTYLGSSSFAASSASVTQPVAKGTSKIVTETTASVPSGDPATITASVVGLPGAAGAATGAVTFSVSPTNSGGQPLTCAGGDSVPLVSGGATCDIAAVGPSGSTYSVTATYSGDSTFATSSSISRTITVH